MSNSSKSISSIILYSVIAAAFIGPGTITTAVTAGSRYQLDLLWAVVFSIAACVLIKEIAARLTIASGLTIGEAIDKKFNLRGGHLIKWIIGGTVILGCAAYEAGNILGAVSGLELLFVGDTRFYTIIVVAIVAFILWTEKRKVISSFMTFFVLLMGVAFFILASNTNHSIGDILISTFHVRILPGSELLTLGLLGTTIVPYNLFLASGIGAGQTIHGMRVGLITSIVVGGIVTATILLAGTVVSSFSSFYELSDFFLAETGKLGASAFAIGLFAAGFSSSITAPFAASLIVTTVFGSKNKKYSRAAWITVLSVGFLMGISGVKPIPVILAVQALNGFILPLITVYLILLVNDPGIVPKAHRHTAYYNIILLTILGVILLLGLNNIDKSFSDFFKLDSANHFELSIAITGLVVATVGFYLWKKPTKKIIEP